MLSSHQVASTSNTQEDEDVEHNNIRDIYALTPPHPPPAIRPRRRETWETSSHRSSALSVSSTDGGSIENFTTVSREFNALVLAGSTVGNNGSENDSLANDSNYNLGRIREDEENPLAIVPDNGYPMDPLPSPRRGSGSASSMNSNHGEVSVQSVKKEEVEMKISAWKNAKIAKINNRFKREDAIINGWESEQVQKSTLGMKKVERKLEEKRARAQEKMQNDIAKAHRKAEERKACAEGRRGTKVGKVFEIANLMKVVGKAPPKRSFF